MLNGGMGLKLNYKYLLTCKSQNGFKPFMLGILHAIFNVIAFPGFWYRIELLQFLAEGTRNVQYRCCRFHCWVEVLHRL
jgi:hypothetical protein